MLEYVALTAAGEGYGEVDEAGASECESDIDGDDAGRMNRLDEQIEFSTGYSYSSGRRRSTGATRCVTTRTTAASPAEQGVRHVQARYGRCEKVDDELSRRLRRREVQQEFLVIGAAALTNKGLTPYMNFCKEKRVDVVKKNKKASFGEVGKILGAMWGKLTDAQKKKARAAAAPRRRRRRPTRTPSPKRTRTTRRRRDGGGRGRGRGRSGGALSRFPGQAMQGAEEDEEPEEEERDEFYNGEADAADADGGDKAARRRRTTTTSQGLPPHRVGGAQLLLRRLPRRPAPDAVLPQRVLDSDDDGYGGRRTTATATAAAPAARAVTGPRRRSRLQRVQ